MRGRDAHAFVRCYTSSHAIVTAPHERVNVDKEVIIVVAFSLSAGGYRDSVAIAEVPKLLVGGIAACVVKELEFLAEELFPVL